MTPLASALYVGRVAHRRLRPRRHFLRYRTYALLLDLDEASAVARRLRLFSLNRFNLFSLHENDYCAPGAGPLRAQIEALLLQAGLQDHSGPIRLLTMPRVLGYAFNPISIFFCYDRDHRLSALLYEVRNTFGQKHSYLLAANVGSDGRARQSCAKQLYVSPFMPMDMTYDFTLAAPDASLCLAIVERDVDGVVMTATQNQKRVALSDGALAKLFVTHPLLTLKVILGIHFEALQLWTKGLRIVARPPPSQNAVSFAPDAPNSPGSHPSKP